MKAKLKEKVIALRKSGHTYSEILKVVPVAKSTVSEWLKDIGIAKSQKQAFTEKKRIASQSGGKARKEQRIKIFNKIVGEAEQEIGKMTKRELWLIGTALYWAEGGKEKEYAPGSGINFSNSDPKMITLFVKWLIDITCVPKAQIKYEIYIHDNYKKEIFRFQKFWSGKTGFPLNCFNKIYFKKNKINSLRKNQGDLYFGVLRVKVSCSSTLNRKITGWVRGINKYWGIV